MPVIDGINWSSKATIPKKPPTTIPLPGTSAFNRTVHGRNGDLLIIQLASGAHLKAARKDTLRSLGLRGINSAALRRSDDPSTSGYIRTVRDLIAVIDLGGVQYKAESIVDVEQAVSYENAQFGSNTRPGGIFRDSEGDYFSFESDRHGVLVNWSTQQDFSSVLEQFLDVFELPEPIAGEHASLLGIQSDETSSDEEEPSSLDVRIGPHVDVIEAPTDEVLSICRSSADVRVRFARLAFRGIDLTWHEPYARFDDRDTVRAELGLFAHRLDVPKAKTLARLTGDPVFFESADCHVQVRENGASKIYDF